MKNAPSCCSPTHEDHNGHDHGNKGFKFDIIFHGSIAIIALTLLAYWLGVQNHYLVHFAHTIIELFGQMWWGVAAGLVFVGIMNKIPRDYFNAILGKGDSLTGILRATVAGLLFDLCSHGILMIGAKLYERGASYGQVVTFLIASPWNSFSMTLILWALIGWKWTLLFIALSAVIAIISGMIVIALTKAGIIPDNPNTMAAPTTPIDLKSRAISDLKAVKWNTQFFKEILTGGLHEAKILIKWLLLGVIIAGMIRAFIPPEHFADWFGPTIAGLGLTLLATTLIEVCSEGSSPIAAELLNKAAAPGNAFTFLMAGVSTDYTEMMILRDVTRSWKMAFVLPIVTVPQVLLLGYLINLFGA
jgi:uncharacterized membrane protein YraQ (UPF0718 family)